MSNEPPFIIVCHQQRVYRLRKAPKYLGMDTHRFNKEVRPYLTEIPIGKQGIGFDVLELDAWLGQYVARKGRPSKLSGVSLWDVKKYRDSRSDMASGELTNESLDNEFMKALELVTSKKPKKS